MLKNWCEHETRRQKLAADPKWQAAAEEQRQAVMARVLGTPKPSEVHLKPNLYTLLAFYFRPVGCRPTDAGNLYDLICYSKERS